MSGENDPYSNLIFSEGTKHPPVKIIIAFDTAFKIAEIVQISALLLYLVIELREFSWWEVEPYSIFSIHGKRSKSLEKRFEFAISSPAKKMAKEAFSGFEVEWMAEDLVRTLFNARVRICGDERGATFSHRCALTVAIVTRRHSGSWVWQWWKWAVLDFHL